VHESILGFAKRHGLYVIEMQPMRPGRISREKCGLIGDAGVSVSFQQELVTGEGGMV